jgi:hypothetical protein
MRTIHDHKVNGLNEAITITADTPASGGASHTYEIALSPEGRPVQVLAVLNFQNGPIQTPADMNGVTNETLLAVVIDRLRGFQDGKYACRENAIALTHIEDALMWLQKRTRDRMARGVEGTHQP